MKQFVSDLLLNYLVSSIHNFLTVHHTWAIASQWVVVIVVDFRSTFARLFAFFISFLDSRKHAHQLSGFTTAQIFPVKTSRGTFNGLQTVLAANHLPLLLPLATANLLGIPLDPTNKGKHQSLHGGYPQVSIMINDVSVFALAFLDDCKQK